MSGSILALSALVTFQAAALDSAFTVGAGNGPMEESFARVADAELGPGGLLFVLDASPPYIRVFDQVGHFVRAFGRQGQGPGELVRPTSVEWLDSTLIVKHSGAVTEFDAEGAFVRFRRLPYASAIAVVRTGRDNYIVLRDGVARRSGTDQDQELLLLSGDGGETLASGVSGTVFHRGPSSWGALVTGICGTLSLDYVGHDVFVLGDGATGEVSLYRGRRRLQTIQVAPPGGPLPKELEAQIRELTGRTSWGRRDLAAHQLMLPEVLSSVCDVQADSPDRAWFRHNGFRDEPEEWWALDLRTGDLSTSFQLEPGARGRSIRDGRIAVLWHDDLGIPYVTVFTIR